MKKNMVKHFYSVDFEEIFNWLCQKGRPIMIENLGGRSSHLYSANTDHHVIFVDNGNGKIKSDLWNRVSVRIDALPPNERQKASKYNDIRPYVQAPSIPAICWAYAEEQNGNIVWQ